MIRLDRCHLLLPRRGAEDMLAAADIDAIGLPLKALHLAIRRWTDPAAADRIDHLVVVPDTMAVELAVRFQEEIGRLDLDPSLVRAESWVVPRSLAILRVPLLAHADEGMLTAALRVETNTRAVVVPDRLVAPATRTFNLHLRDQVPHGWSEREPTR